MESPSDARVWLECLEMKDKGYFYEAEKKLRALLEIKTKDKSEIIIELIDTLCIRGMYALAFDYVESHVSEWSEDKLGASSTIRMIRAYCRARVRIKFQDGLEMVRKYQGLRPCKGEPVINAASVSLPPHNVSNLTLISIMDHWRRISVVFLVLCGGNRTA